jgi:hypothetical protein
LKISVEGGTGFVDIAERNLRGAKVTDSATQVHVAAGFFSSSSSSRKVPQVSRLRKKE